MDDIESINDWAFPDSRLLTDQQRQELCKILFKALLEIRKLGNEGKAEQAADVADAFHNLPAYLRYNGMRARANRPAGLLWYDFGIGEP